jgi:hypothetical protein
LSETTTFISVEVDVVNEQRSGAERAGGNSGLAGSDGATADGTGEVAVRQFAELKVNLDFVVLQSNQRQSKTRVAVPNYLIFR